MCCVSVTEKSELNRKVCVHCNATFHSGVSLSNHLRAYAHRKKKALLDGTSMHLFFSSYVKASVYLSLASCSTFIGLRSYRMRVACSLPLLNFASISHKK